MLASKFPGLKGADLPRGQRAISIAVETLPEGEPGEIRIGCAGWNIARLNQIHFPAQGSHLARYAQVFGCCEINSSFYRPHQWKTWARWAESVPDGFQFAVKAPRAITHESKLQCEPQALQEFLAQLAPLGAKLGPVLFQLPPSLEFSPKPAKKFLQQVRECFGGSVVFEPRHPSWFGRRADTVLDDFSVSRAAVDPACVPAAGSLGGWRGLTYFRLHGSPRMYYSSYGKAFLRNLASEMKGLANSMPVWCIFDNTALGAATGNALELVKLVSAAS